VSLLFDFLDSFAGAASALPDAFPLLLQQLPAVAEELQDLPSADFVAVVEELQEAFPSADFSVEADALEAQQLPPVDFDDEQDAFSVVGFCSFALVVCALAATPMKATKANKAINFFMSF
jgi:hypothetical protein